MDNHTDVRGLTVMNPWAKAIEIGAKRIETRSWSTNYRGPLLIHAGLNRDAFKHPGKYHDTWAALQDVSLGAFSFGAIIAVAELWTCIPTADLLQNGVYFDEAGLPAFTMSDRQRALGDYTPGRHAWLLRSIRALPKPIPFKGKQGLWRVPADVWAEVQRQLAEVG